MYLAISFMVIISLDYHLLGQVVEDAAIIEQQSWKNVLQIIFRTIETFYKRHPIWNPNILNDRIFACNLLNLFVYFRDGIAVSCLLRRQKP